MPDRITPHELHQAGGVDDWRVLAHGASALFRTGSCVAGVTLVNAIAERAEAASHQTSTCGGRVADAEDNEVDIATSTGRD